MSWPVGLVIVSWSHDYTSSCLVMHNSEVVYHIRAADPLRDISTSPKGQNVRNFVDIHHDNEDSSVCCSRHRSVNHPSE